VHFCGPFRRRVAPDELKFSEEGRGRGIFARAVTVAVSDFVGFENFDVNDRQWDENNVFFFFLFFFLFFFI
jgi:hypothetical protein